MTDNLMASNVDAERFVLGSILLDDSFLADVGLTADQFSLEKHRRIFWRMGEIAARGERVDRVSLAHELTGHRELEACDGLGYLISLDDGLPLIPNLDGYTRIVREMATLRQIAHAGANLSTAAMQPGADSAALLKSASTQFLSLASAQPDDGLQNPHEILIEELARVGVDGFFSGGARGIHMPLEWLNSTLAGLHPGDLTLLGARPSVGKTALALQIAHRAALDGHGCIFFSLEMAKVPLALRIACSAANVDSQVLRLGMLQAHERKRLLDAIAQLEHLPLWIDKSCRTVAAMHAKVRQARVKQAVDLIFVDYIQLMSSDGRAENQNVKVSEISRGLKLMAEEFGVPVVALSQLSRPAKGSNPDPTLADLRDSGSLEQDADVVIFLHSPDGNLGTGPRRLIVAKQRNGPVDATSVEFVGRYQRFEALAEEMAA